MHGTSDLEYTVYLACSAEAAWDAITNARVVNKYYHVQHLIRDVYQLSVTPGQATGITKQEDAIMLEKIMPEMPMDDVASGVSHYRDVLGFSVNYEQHDIGVMDRDSVRLLLIARTESHSGIGSCYIYVADADALHTELVGKGADVQGEPISRPWGLREFTVLDPEGNRLTFGQPFE